MAIAKTLLTKSVLSVVLLLVASTTAFAGPNCTCRFAGQNYKTGDIMCIRGKLSRCDFVLNNTSWKTIAETCPQAMVPELFQPPAIGAKATFVARMQSRFSIK